MSDTVDSKPRLLIPINLIREHAMNDLLNDNEMVDMQFITTYTKMTDKYFYKLISEGKFPKQIKIGRSSRWFKNEVVEWLMERVRESRE